MSEAVGKLPEMPLKTMQFAGTSEFRQSLLGAMMPVTPDGIQEDLDKARVGLQQRAKPANNGEPPLALLHKLANVLQETKGLVPEKGENVTQHYKYARDEDVVMQVRDALAQQRVLLLPAVQSVSIRAGAALADRQGQVRQGMPVTCMHMLWTLIDAESGQQWVIPWYGEGADTGDKGCWKALTGARKYLLRMGFLLGSSDDPERDDNTPSQTSGGPRSSHPSGPPLSPKQIGYLRARAEEAQLSITERDRLVFTASDAKRLEDAPANRFEAIRDAFKAAAMAKPSDIPADIPESRSGDEGMPDDKDIPF